MSRIPTAESLAGSRAGVAILIAALFCVGCTKGPADREGCSSSHMRIIAAILADEDLEAFAATYLEDSKRLTVVWDEGPQRPQTCKSENVSFTVTNSFARPRGDTDQRIAIHKMFYDEDAAYVELALYPTGKQGDFFLRKAGAWKVAQHAFREVKPFREKLDELLRHPERDADKESIDQVH